MADSNQIKESRRVLEQKWDAEGGCPSCGWHALLSEHDVEDDDISQALDGDGRLYLYCQSKDDEDSFSHRKIVINIKSE